MAQKKMLFLGGFPQMIDIVFNAKDMGIYTIVVDRDDNSPAKRFTDKAVHMSTDRIDDLEALCRTENIDGVFTGFEDFNIHIARELCSRLHLPFYANAKQLHAVTNKECFKEYCRRYGVPVVEQYTLDQALQAQKFPYIVKPADSYGSRGITVCDSIDVLQKGYERALLNSASQSTIIERFVDSDHGCEMFYTIVNGHIHLTATADRYTVRSGTSSVPLPVAEVFPSRHQQDMLCQIDPLVREMMKGMGLQNGLVLIQMLYQDEKFYVYEMAYRLTGEQHYRLVAQQHGINLGRMMIALALGEDISSYDTEQLDTPAFVKPSINLAVLLNPGTICKLEGLEKVYQLDEVISYNLTHKVNDVVATCNNYSTILIRLNMLAENTQLLSQAVEEVNRLIKVIDTAGNDMITARFHFL